MALRTMNTDGHSIMSLQVKKHHPCCHGSNIYGIWTAQLASKQERMPLTENIFDEFEKHLDSFRLNHKTCGI
jgi:hypothetical protein